MQFGANADPFRPIMGGIPGLAFPINFLVDNIRIEDAPQSPSAPAGMRIVQATYGKNRGVPAGNFTGAVASACAGSRSCTYDIVASSGTDPAPGSGKDFTVDTTKGGTPRASPSRPS